jgi:hypothetical protein
MPRWISGLSLVPNEVIEGVCLKCIWAVRKSLEKYKPQTKKRNSRILL